MGLMVSQHTSSTSYHGQTSYLANTNLTATLSQHQPQQGTSQLLLHFLNLYFIVLCIVGRLPAFLDFSTNFIRHCLLSASEHGLQWEISLKTVSYSEENINRTLRILALPHFPLTDLSGFKLKIKFQVINFVFWDFSSNSPLKLRIARF